MSELKPGRYRHYKGNDYEVIGVARHSETEALLVVYRPLYGKPADGKPGEHGEGSLWVRPLPMFTESVMVDGERVPRFRYLESE